MNPAYIMDTSFLLELNEISRKNEPPQIIQAKKKYATIDDEADIYITVPILFEYAGHLSNLNDGTVKRNHIIQLNEGIRGSLDDETPWIIYGKKEQVLLTTSDILALSERFAATNEKHTYSFADLSIIQVKEQLLKKGAYDEVEILTFEEELASYSAFLR